MNWLVRLADAVNVSRAHDPLNPGFGYRAWLWPEAMMYRCPVNEERVFVIGARPSHGRIVRIG